MNYSLCPLCLCGELLEVEHPTGRFLKHLPSRHSFAGLAACRSAFRRAPPRSAMTGTGYCRWQGFGV